MSCLVAEQREPSQFRERWQRGREARRALNPELVLPEIELPQRCVRRARARGEDVAGGPWGGDRAKAGEAEMKHIKRIDQSIIE